ncbi:hypothetical protein F4604DRAFT_1935257 [Suillus subluteus]|nr:hypothetical protein F4604DRAFT_1935257 [Suillus subluteus]
MAASSPTAASATLHLISFYHSCTLADAGRTLSTWFFYLAAMLYDIMMVTTSTIHLLHYNPLSSRVERLVRVLIYDGIGYFIVLTASNVLNLILYHTTNFETQRFCWLVPIVSHHCRKCGRIFCDRCSSHQALLESLMPMPTFSWPTPYILNFASAAKVTSNPPPHPPEAPTGFNPMLLNSMSPDGGFPAPSISHLLNGAGSSTVPAQDSSPLKDVKVEWHVPSTEDRIPRDQGNMTHITDEPKGDKNGSDSTIARETAICIQPGDEDETTGKDLYLLKRSFLNTPFTHFFTRPSRPALSTPSTLLPAPACDDLRLRKATFLISACPAWILQA